MVVKKFLDIYSTIPYYVVVICPESLEIKHFQMTHVLVSVYII